MEGILSHCFVYRFLGLIYHHLQTRLSTTQLFWPMLMTEAMVDRAEQPARQQLPLLPPQHPSSPAVMLRITCSQGSETLTRNPTLVNCQMVHCRTSPLILTTLNSYRCHRQNVRNTRHLDTNTRALFCQTITLHAFLCSWHTHPHVLANISLQNTEMSAGV